MLKKRRTFLSMSPLTWWYMIVHSALGCSGIFLVFVVDVKLRNLNLILCWSSNHLKLTLNYHMMSSQAHHHAHVVFGTFGEVVGVYSWRVCWVSYPWLSPKSYRRCVLVPLPWWSNTQRIRVGKHYALVFSRAGSRRQSLPPMPWLQSDEQDHCCRSQSHNKKLCHCPFIDVLMWSLGVFHLVVLLYHFQMVHHPLRRYQPLKKMNQGCWTLVVFYKMIM